MRSREDFNPAAWDGYAQVSLPDCSIGVVNLESPFLKAVHERVVIYDGAMGSLIQDMNPSLDDFWGKENCSEVLNLSRPEMIRDIHAQYLCVGADVIETNTFGATNIVLAEFGLQDR